MLRSLVAREYTIAERLACDVSDSVLKIIRIEGAIKKKAKRRNKQ